MERMTCASLVLALGFVAAPLRAEGHRPDLVLWGTDVRGLADVEVTSVASDPTGRYHLEMGGAEAALDIVAEGAGWRVTREVSIPGGAPLVAEYVVIREGGLLRDEAGKIEIRGLSEALLVFEDAGTDMPPKELWLIYDPQ